MLKYILNTTNNEIKNGVDGWRITFHKIDKNGQF